MKITMIDNFDSFTFNLVDYFKQTGAEVTVYRNTVPVETVVQSQPDLVVYSPGPGRPEDAGNLFAYMKRFTADRVPQFGVCLGLQGLVEVFGGSLRVLDRPVHGKASLITHDTKGMFAELPNPFLAGRYHSLAVATMPDDFEVCATTDDQLQDQLKGSEQGDGKGDEVIMAIRHKSLPIRAVQFHPESILTFQNEAGMNLIQNIVAL